MSDPGQPSPPPPNPPTARRVAEGEGEPPPFARRVQEREVPPRAERAEPEARERESLPTVAWGVPLFIFLFSVTTFILLCPCVLLVFWFFSIFKFPHM